MSTLVTVEEIRAAARRLDGVTVRTPLVPFPDTKPCLLLKPESLQPTGSFKLRGAFSAISALPGGQRAKGVVAHSSGNHGLAVAYAAEALGVPAVVVVPHNAAEVKVAAAARHGARIVTVEPTLEARIAGAQELIGQHGYTLIPPFDHRDVIAGQGTAVKELLEDVGPLDYLFVCCGGAGLLSGSALAASHLSPGTRVVGVEPAAGDDAARSLRTRTLQRVEDPQTIADGARTQSLGALTFPLVLRYVHDIITVTDPQLVEAMRFLWERMKLVVEPTGALATAGVLSGPIDVRDRRVGIILSGGNVDLKDSAKLFA